MFELNPVSDDSQCPITVESDFYDEGILPIVFVVLYDPRMSPVPSRTAVLRVRSMSSTQPRSASSSREHLRRRIQRGNHQYHLMLIGEQHSHCLYTKLIQRHPLRAPDS